jgi:Zn-dependent peptidase ImmA (M78 family)/transcriptional regulator with XRE-family HTH domain
MIGDRLKRAREAAGFSLRDLEGKIGKEVSAQAIGKYERSEMTPGSTVLLRLAKALNVTPEYLLRTRDISLVGVDFRKATRAGAKDVKSVEAMVLDHVERYLELEYLMPDTELTWVAPSGFAFNVHEIGQAEIAAETLREQWSLGIAPIANMTELLEIKGIKVISLDLPENVSGSKAFVRRPDAEDVAVIVVNRAHNGDRQRFTLAHELAHLAMTFIGMTETEQEKAADRFAGAFLMAKRMVQSLLGINRTSISIGELVELKKVFMTSVACLVVRCSQLEILSKACYGKLWAQIRKLGWNAPGSSEPNQCQREVPQRMTLLGLRAVVEQIISKAKAAELLRINARELDRLLEPERSLVPT